MGRMARCMVLVSYMHRFETPIWWFVFGWLMLEIDLGKVLVHVIEGMAPLCHLTLGSLSL